MILLLGRNEAIRLAFQGLDAGIHLAYLVDERHLEVQARFCTGAVHRSRPVSPCQTAPRSFCPSSTMKMEEKQTMAATAMTPIEAFHLSVSPCAETITATQRGRRSWPLLLDGWAA